MKKLDRIVFCFFAALAVLWAGGKARVVFPRTDPEAWYLMDGGSAVTNDVVSVRFVRNPILPPTASVFMDGMDVAYTNDEDWATHSFPAYSNRLDQLEENGFDFPFPNATNYNWSVYTDWTPTPIVHTNGVAFVLWQQAGGNGRRLTVYRTGVYADQSRLAPNPWITNSPPSATFSLSSAANQNTDTEADDEEDGDKQ